MVKSEFAKILEKKMRVQTDSTPSTLTGNLHAEDTFSGSAWEPFLIQSRERKRGSAKVKFYKTKDSRSSRKDQENGPQLSSEHQFFHSSDRAKQREGARTTDNNMYKFTDTFVNDTSELNASRGNASGLEKDPANDSTIKSAHDSSDAEVHAKNYDFKSSTDSTKSSEASFFSTRSTESLRVTEPTMNPFRLYLLLVDGATYLAWTQLRTLGTSSFMMDSLEWSEAKRAYRKLARQWHPDIVGTNQQEKFLLLKSAYDIMEEAFIKNLTK